MILLDAIFRDPCCQCSLVFAILLRERVVSLVSGVQSWAVSKVISLVNRVQNWAGSKMSCDCCPVSPVGLLICVVQKVLAVYCSRSWIYDKLVFG